MPTIEQNRETWSSYDWVGEAGEEWSSAWGGSEMLWHVTLLPRLRGFLPTRTVLEIAPGGGRITTYLLAWCDRMHLVDIASPAKACRQRFRNRRNMSYHLGDGRSLASIDDGSIDLAFSWDSLVHADVDALEGYVADLARKLAPRGVALLHHSNLAACRLPGGAFAADMDQAVNGWRATSVSAERFRELCRANGLACPVQEIFPWSRPEVESDCLSLVVRGQASAASSWRVIRTNMPGEMAIARCLRELYGPYWKPRDEAPTAATRRRWWWDRRNRVRRQPDP